MSLIVTTPDRLRALREASLHWASWDLRPAQLASLELLAGGAYAPLDRFMTAADVASVQAGGRLPNGEPWPAPVVFEVDEAFARERRPGETVALRDAEGVLLAALHVEEAWTGGGGAWHLGGPVEAVGLPLHHDHHDLRVGFDGVRGRLSVAGRPRAVAFQPGAFLHRGHVAALARLADLLDATVLLQVLAAPEDSDRLGHFARVASIQRAAEAFRDRAILTVAPDPSATGTATGDVLLRAVVARSAGCTHLALDAEDLGARGLDPEALRRGAAGLGIELVVLPEMRYRPADDTFVPAGEPGAAGLQAVTTREVTGLLGAGRDVPAWMVGPAGVEALQAAHPPRAKQGFTVFFTGLSGSGKSTIANALRVRLLERTGRPVTLLDGDLVRKHLSSELGFSREHRDLNILRIGYVASEITRHRGIAVCCPIAPYDAVRKRVRALIEPLGGFVLVHVATSLEECERRDRKGLYAKARAGLIPQFTGISDPYEAPADAAVTIHTEETPVEEAAGRVIDHLAREGYL